MKSPPCYYKYITDFTRYVTTPGCWDSMQIEAYNAAVCDPIPFSYMKCVVQAAGLLNSDGSFNDAAFKTTTLQNKCSSDTAFSTAYQSCSNSTMKYMNYPRLFVCLGYGGIY
ncbi:uncharacterized protein LOC108673216 [Hyalella azteca]|uniref:Uncharacterized protein LOC108673216 n=1 Tax=Hyalella azteca TaxID=294128 RepID=A0A8B7NU34_HYAAZ|nr:uncharacterized protein LOC108673216 [Hyalella azteca]